jgi:hypothetical protein
MLHEKSIILESRLFLLGGFLVVFGLCSLLPDAHQSGIRPGLPQDLVSIRSTLDILDLDLLDRRNILDLESLGQSSNETLALLCLLDVGRFGVQLCVLALATREENKALLVLLKTSNVDLDGLFANVLAAGIDRDTDGGRQLAWDTGFLIAVNSTSSTRPISQTFNSAKENPRPARTRRLYLTVGQRTTGLSLSTGRGATRAAFLTRFARRLDLRPA